jgi:ribose transport system ATP-binding protein
MRAITIHAAEISKQFGSTRALDAVSVSFVGGEVHGIIGENGAGKSTLMKILSGVERPSSGRIVLDGQAIHFNNVVQAERAGVVMIHQELNLVDELSVAENLFLGREKTAWGLMARAAARKKAAEILDRLQTPIDPRRRLGDCSLAQRQMVEIGKALAREARVLIMDEPTAVLTRPETEALFHVIDQLRADGVAVIYISHLLPEVLRICDRVTVLRDGKRVASLEGAEMTAATEIKLARLMVGREMGKHYPERPARKVESREAVLRVERLSTGDRVCDVSFDVAAGEIVGFAGLIGAGRTEMAETIAGLRRRSGGAVFLHGEPLNAATTRDAVRAGLAYLSEDRKGSGLTLPMSITQNITLVSLRRYSRLLINRRRERAAAKAQRERLRIKADRLGAPVSTLSGGNQQKVLLAKWLETRPKVLIVDEPTRGVDVGAREEIYRLLRELTSEGMACIMISSDLNEVLGMSDQIAVMRGGRIVGMLEGDTATEESVMRLAAGVGEAVGADARAVGSGAAAYLCPGVKVVKESPN